MRYERLDDEGLFAGSIRSLQEITLTAEYKFADGFLVRGEFRRDWSDEPFFPGRQRFAELRIRTRRSSAGVWWIGNKTGSW